MASNQDPVVLELAPLPREQIGPFLLLGLEKDAGPEEIEAHWAQRVLWARKKQIRTALSDINWAREVINDPERRVRADVESLNVDTSEGTLKRLDKEWSGSANGRPAWHPLEIEKSLTGIVDAGEIPDCQQVRDAITVPAIPEGAPGVAELLRQFVQQPLDPWTHL
jgi:hypothetical protein